MNSFKSFVLLLPVVLTSCTLRIVDDTADFDIDASMKAEGCEVEINRKEGKTSGTKRAQVTR